MKDMTDGALLDVLGHLLEPQFEALVLRAQVPRALVSPAVSPLGTRVVELVRWTQQAEAHRLAVLEALEHVLFEKRPLARAVARVVPIVILLPVHLKLHVIVFALGGTVAFAGWASLWLAACHWGMLPTTSTLSLWSAVANGSLADWTWEPADGARAAALRVDAPQPSGAPVTLKFDFGQTKSPDPRATFILNNVAVQDWSQTPVLALDLHSTIAQPLELTVSLLGDGRWYEFGEFVPITPANRTVLFHLDRRRYKTNSAPDTYTQPADLTRIERLDLIVIPKVPGPGGRNLGGGVIVDNVRLRSPAGGWSWLLPCCGNAVR
jgi:hypothetical protein